MSVTLKNAFQYHLRPQHFDPKDVPATQETLFDADVYVELVTLSNRGASEATVTVKDRQSTPKELLNAVPVAPNGVVVIQMAGRYCPNGLTWIASAADTIVGYVRGRSS